MSLLEMPVQQPVSTFENTSTEICTTPRFAVILREIQCEVGEGRPFEDRLCID